MRVITAPEKYERGQRDVVCFLAGGITNCPDWQADVIATLMDMERRGINLEHLVLINPRRENFPIGDTVEGDKQIRWEFKYLEDCDIFSMYFTNGESDQPICMYELGRNLVRMSEKFMISWPEKLVVSVEDGYRRRQDVIVQTELATRRTDMVNEHATPSRHAHGILMSYTWATEDL